MTIDSRTADLAKVADALDQLDSHGIYGGDAPGMVALAAAGIDIAKLSSQSVPEVERDIMARGLGGWVQHETGCRAATWRIAECACRLYTGHVVSAEVVRLLGFVDAGGAFFGRGSAHRARIAQLRNGGAPK